MNVAGFRANLDECSRIQGQLGGMYQDSETTRGNYRHIKGHFEGIIGGFKANLEECSRIQGQLGGNVGGIRDLEENVGEFRTTWRNVARFRANLEIM
jgi:hypothetical protein